MRGRTFFAFGIAVGLSTLPLKSKDSQGCSMRRSHNSGYNLVPVVVAAVDMPEGTLVTFDHISQRSVPEQFVTSSVVKPDSASYVVGQRLQNAVQAGDPLRWADFATVREGLESKGRMVSLALDPARALHGQLRAKDRVDVLAAITDPASNERVVHTAVENARVLGVSATGVQLFVTSEEAEKLLLLEDVGRLSLSLRNAADTETLDQPRRTTIKTVLERPPNTGRCHLIRGPAHWGG